MCVYSFTVNKLFQAYTIYVTGFYIFANVVYTSEMAIICHIEQVALKNRIANNSTLQLVNLNNLNPPNMATSNLREEKKNHIIYCYNSSFYYVAESDRF